MTTRMLKSNSALNSVFIFLLKLVCFEIAIRFQEDRVADKVGGFAMRYGLLLQAAALAGMTYALLSLGGGLKFIEQVGEVTITMGSLG